MAFTDLFKLYNVVFEKNPFIKDRVMDFDTFERIFVPFCRADGVNIGKNMFLLPSKQMFSRIS